MKKTLLITVSLIFITSAVQAQINKGSLLLGGNLSVGTVKYENSSIPVNDFRQNDFTFSPSIGIATSDNNVWGITLGYSHNKNKNTNAPGLSEVNSYNGGIFYRKYMPLGKSFYLFGQAKASYGSYRQETEYGNGNKNDRKTWSISLSAAPGIAYAVSKRFHLEASLNDLVSLGYSHTDETNTSNGQKNLTTSNGLSLSTNISSTNPLSIGFRFVFAK